MKRNLKELRESKNMTQKQFAESLGLKLTTYNGYETGSREPDSDFWISIAKKYHVTIDYLMGYSSDPHKTGAETTKNPPAPAEPEQGEEKSMMAFAKVLVSAGLIEEGFQLSDRDAEFLGNALRSIDMWFEERKKNQE